MSALLAVLLAAALPSPACDAGHDGALARGFALYEEDRYPAAGACFQRALARALHTADAPAEAESRRGLGRTLYRQGYLKEAEEELETARTLFEAAGNALGAARTRSHLGSVALQAGERARARALYDEARAALETLGPAAEADLALVLYNLVYLETDEQTLRRLADDGLRLARRAGDRATEGRFVQMQGDEAAQAGDYAGARVLHQRALRLFEASRSRSLTARVLVSASRLALAQGDAAEALGLSRRALVIQRATGDARGQALSLDYLAIASGRLGRHRQALGYLAEASRLARQRGDDGLVDILAVRTAEAHLRMGAYARAVASVRAGLRPSLDPANAPDAYDLLARALLGLARDAEALSAAERAVALAREKALPLFGPLETRARARERTGDVPGALADVREAIDVVERTRARLVPTDFLKQGFGERHQALFARAIDLQARSGLPEEALATAEQARARAFQDLLATRAAGADGDAQDSSRHATAPSVAEIAASAQRLGSTVVSYWVGAEATLVWTLDGAGVLHVVRVPVGADRIARLVSAASAGPRASIERGAASAVPPAEIAPAAARRTLYRLLVAPIEPWLPAADGLLTIVPHGPLFRLSFAALRDRHGRYLVERYAMHYVPAAGVLRFSADARRRASAEPRHALLVADPSPLPPAPAALRPLPAARHEVDAVRTALGTEATRLVARAASEPEVVARLADSTTVHLATHGLVDDDRSLDSFVALGRTGPSAATDGRLTAAEVYDLRLRADLVFLSACRSGRGRVTGDGILGLTRAFLSAGAATVVATLWDVADEPAAQLVPRFYDGLAREGSKSRALRRAQLALIGRLRAGRVRVRSAAGELRLDEDPALWAAFVVVGEP